MTTDGLKGFSVEYNPLNLPKKVSKGTDNISYIYTAAGAKLAKLQNGTLKQLYAGSLVYNSSKLLDYILNDEGMVVKQSGGFEYQYFMKDHLGNTRAVFKDSLGIAKIKQVADYYPFGSRFVPFNPESSNKYLYNGKELQDDVIGGTTMDWLDYGARFYDPVIGRFIGIDPLADFMSGIGSYAYAYNNPINNVDRMGMDVVNAHKGDLEKAKKEAEDAKKTRTGLGKDASKKEIKKADSKVKKAEANVEKQQGLFDAAQAQIDDLKNNHSEFFKELDNLKDEAGDIIDVSISVQDNFLFTSGGCSGRTYADVSVTKDANGQTIAVLKTLKDGTQIFTIQGGISGKQNQIDIVIDSKYGTPGVASHEGGHAEYLAKFFTSYMNWMWDREAEGKNMSNHNGHNYGDPSGLNAVKRTNEYLKLNPDK